MNAISLPTPNHTFSVCRRTWNSRVNPTARAALAPNDDSMLKGMLPQGIAQGRLLAY
jgi:hypothetical protein